MGSAFVKVSVGIGVEIVGRVVVVEFDVIGDDIGCESGCEGS